MKLSMRDKLICFGDLCVDIAAKTPQHEGADVTVTNLSFRSAGAAANCAIAAAKEGAEVELLGLVGEDILGEWIKDHLAAMQVNTTGVKTVSGKTGTIISIVDCHGQTKFYSYRGVNATTYGDVPEPLLGTQDWLYLSGYSFQAPESQVTAEKLLLSRGKCALDPSFQFAREFRTRYLYVCQHVDLLFPNLEEARLMTGLDSPEESAAALRQCGAKTVVVKLGGRGCYLCSDHVIDFVPAEPAAALDTTGAGDTFAGAFLAAIIQGQDILQAARQGNQVARRLVTEKR